jgi:DNA invertase Pin-like site-specific DNA recombinase
MAGMAKIAARAAPAALPLVAYYRVSTERQGRSGLGLEAQREAVARYAAGAGGTVIASYQEVESGRRADRPQLRDALAACRAHGAALVIAKLDRLARNVRFLLEVVHGSGSAGVVFCDLPQLPPGPSGRFILTLFAAVAELETGLISQRTRDALAAAKARGVRLGNPRLIAGSPGAAEHARAAAKAAADRHALAVRPYVDQARASGAVSLRMVAASLTARGVRPPGRGTVWSAEQVRRVIERTRRLAGGI